MCRHGSIFFRLEVMDECTDAAAWLAERRPVMEPKLLSALEQVVVARTLYLLTRV